MYQLSSSIFHCVYLNRAPINSCFFTRSRYTRTSVGLEFILMKCALAVTLSCILYGSNKLKLLYSSIYCCPRMRNISDLGSWRFMWGLQVYLSICILLNSFFICCYGRITWFESIMWTLIFSLLLLLPTQKLAAMNNDIFTSIILRPWAPGLGSPGAVWNTDCVFIFIK